MILFQDVTKTYKNNLVGVKDINLEIGQGEFLFLLGKSGAGKSTLIKLITKEINPTKGEIHIENIILGQVAQKEIPFFRRSLGIVHQEAGLLEYKTVYDNVAFAMMATEQPYELICDSVPTALGIVGLRQKAQSMPHELSGGEQFKVALARAIVNSPRILIADEPTANLDPDTAWDIMCLLDEINRKGVTVLVATHAYEMVNIMKKRVVTLYEGRIIGDVRSGKYGYLV